jgi:glycosyltransferase involved in cell wall biosynthesis
LIGTIGQLGLRKGQDVLLRAATIVARSMPDVHCLIVGQRNSEKDESRQFESGLHGAASGALASRVHFLGRRNDVGQILNELTLLVHPARQEPLGRVLIEAAAAGLAVVATEVGGTAEIFPPGCDAARLVPPDDADALAAALLELLGDPAMRERLGAAARRRAEEQFDLRTAAANLLGHYEAILV